MGWRPDGKLLASSGWDNAIRLWDPATGSCVQVLRDLDHPETHFFGLAWSPDGTRLASGGGSRDSGELFVWDGHSGECIYALQGLAGVIYTIAWNRVGDQLISGGSNGRLSWWGLLHGECVRVRKAHQGAVQSLKHSPDGRRLASCGDDGVINVWDLQSGDLLQTLRRDRPYERLDITGIRGLTQAQKATLRALGAMENAPVPGTG